MQNTRPRVAASAALVAAVWLAALAGASLEAEAASKVWVGTASYYGAEFANRKTASGERFDPQAMTAASKTLPLDARVAVKNLDNGREVVVRINDRGPYTKGRILDLSRIAAKKLGMLGDGTAPVRIRLLKK